MRPESTTKRARKQSPPPYGYIVLPDGTWRARHITKNGYAYFCVGNKHIREHRWIWEQWHGPIPAGYVVHHRDETVPGRSRNTRDNLCLMTIGEHVALHNRKWSGPCAIEGCDAPIQTGGFCRKHYWEAYHAAHKDDPSYKARQLAQAKRWQEAHPERVKEVQDRSNRKRRNENREYFREHQRGYYHRKMQDPEWREKERLRAAAKNARVAAERAQAKQRADT